MRALGPGSATAVVVAAMVGTGVFTTSGYLLADLGSPWLVLLAWVIGGVVAALGAVCYGALARRLPESGGEYLFLSRTLHPLAGTLAGWVTFLVGFAAPVAAAALGFAEYARPWLPAALPPRAWASLLLVGTAALHATSLAAAGRVQALAVAAESLVIVLFVAFGAARVSAPPVALPPVAPGAFAVSLMWVSYSYSGWNTAVYVAGEVRDPERSLPRAMLLGAGLVTVLYVALNAVFLFAAPPAALAGRMDVARVAAAALGGPALAAAISALIAFVLATFASAMAMAGPHVIARMAADGVLPRPLAAGPGRPPRAAGLAQLALALVLVWSAAYDGLLTYVGFTLGLCTAATVVGLVRLRRREGAALRVPGWPWVPALFLACVLGMTAFTVVQRPRAAAVGLGTLLLGAAAFAARRRRRP